MIDKLSAWTLVASDPSSNISLAGSGIYLKDMTICNIARVLFSFLNIHSVDGFFRTITTIPFSWSANVNCRQIAFTKSKIYCRFNSGFVMHFCSVTLS